jgi:hypothetical protein
MSKPRAAIDERLASAQLAIEGAINDANIQSALAAYGYSLERLEEGKALHTSALALHKDQQVRYGDLFAAKDALTGFEQQARLAYMRHVRVARVVFMKDRGTLHKLGLTSARKKTLAGWLLQADQFYTNALLDPTIVSALAAHRVPVQQLEAGKLQVGEIAARRIARNGHKGTARAATRSRDMAMDALEQWLAAFKAMARVALEDQPHTLEKLGLTRTSARRAARPAMA